MPSSASLSYDSRASKRRGLSAAVLGTIGLSLTMGIGANAQTPPSNYAVLMFPSPLPDIKAIDKSDSTSAVGKSIYVGEPYSKLTIGASLAKSLLSGPQSSGPEALSGPWVVLHKKFSNSGNSSFIYAATVQKTGAPVIDLSTVATGQLGGYRPTTANAIDGTVIGGFWDRSTQNYQTIHSAAIWNWTGTQWTFTDVHQASQINTLLGPDSQSEIFGISYNSLSASTTGVGFGASSGGKAKPLRWEWAGGNFTVKMLDTSLLGASDLFGIGLKAEEETTVGYGYGSLTGAREPGNYITSWPFLRHAIRWEGIQATDLHTATNLNTLLGAQAESNCVDVANNIMVGTGQGANNGPKILWSPPATDRFNYPSRALRWTKNEDGSFTAMSLSQFLPTVAPSIVTEDYVSSITKDGSILGSRQVYDAQNNYSGSGTVIWKPLATDASYSLIVPLEAKAYIVRPFTQNAGQTQVYGELLLGTNNTGTLTVEGGSVSNDGTIRGIVALNGGSLSGTGTIQGNVINYGGVFKPGKAGTTLTTTDPLLLSGSFRQTAGGTLGVVANNGLIISGSAILGGNLGIVLPKGTTPVVGSAITVLTCGSVSGMFASIPMGWTLTSSTTGTFPRQTVIKAVYVGTGKPRF
jgi:hypothetical protein